ncbi:MAG: hypothetical protein QW543_05490 [Sulfolobales archaeon]
MVGNRVNSRVDLHYSVNSRQRSQCAKIVTFRVNAELNELIVVAAKEAGKSKSEFIRDSIVEFMKFLEMNLGTEVTLMKHVRNPNNEDKDRFNEYVVLV